MHTLTSCVRSEHTQDQDQDCVAEISYLASMPEAEYGQASADCIPRHLANRLETSTFSDYTVLVRCTALAGRIHAGFSKLSNMKY